MLPGTVSISSDLGPAAAVREHVDAYWRTWELHRRRFWPA